MKGDAPEKPKKPMPKWQCYGLRIIGICIFLLAIWFCLHGFYAFRAGDIEVGQNYRGVEMISNRDYRIAILLAVAGVVFFANSFPGDKDEKNDKDLS
ncbi:MAG TPA: hypothetical protein VGI03_10345 [Verrucomicrobiae bacterium]|jgi:hypothetical protein